VPFSIIEIKRKLIVKYFFITEFMTISFSIFLESVNFGQGPGQESSLTTHLIFSQWMCLVIYGFVILAFRISRTLSAVKKGLIFFLFVPTGALLGIFLGARYDGYAGDIFELTINYPDLFVQLIFLGIMLGSGISFVYQRDETNRITKAKLQEEEFKRLSNEKKLMESNLRLMQAQIEPHFLFNTLNSILSLLDTDPEKGKTMLLQFTQYLRMSLKKYRQKTTTLRKEMEMIQAYLEIFKGRMGKRLEYSIDMAEDVAEFSIPTMLIQPLVENAIKHGLEPKIEGGNIRIYSRKKNDCLKVEIIDTGLGFDEKSQLGIGLTNIKDRLKTLYGRKGRFMLEDNRPSGLKAVIEVPHAKD
jgi:hypothetical protein